jgi:hypothetical protein
VAGDPARDVHEPSEHESPRTEEQDVAGGVAEETPAAVLFTVIATVGVLVAIVLGIAALAYWLA